MNNQRILSVMLWVIACILPPAGLMAAEYPARPVSLITSSAPGGVTDIVARLVGERLSKTWGVPVIVENRPGANGTIGAAAAVRANPDGYTMLVTSESALTIAPVVMDTMPFSPESDLVPVTLLATSPFILVANPKTGFRSVQDMIAAAKKDPGSIRFGSAGEASVHYLAMLSLMKLTDIDMLHVPYRAGPMGMADLVGGNIDVMFFAAGPANKQIEAGKLSALGVTSPRQETFAPGVPPIVDTVKGYGFESWFGLFAPKGTPADILEKVRGEVAKILGDPEVLRTLGEAGINAQSSDQAALAARLTKDTSVIRQLLKGSKR